MLAVKPYLCTGCRSCEMACAFAHAGPGAERYGLAAGVATSGCVRPGRSRVKVAVDSCGASGIPMLCLQCDSARCVAACAYGALTRSGSTGAIELDAARCTHCRLCTAACPFGNIELDASRGELVKCDLCLGDPACAKFCPSGALRVEAGAA